MLPDAVEVIGRLPDSSSEWDPPRRNISWVRNYFHGSVLALEISGAQSLTSFAPSLTSTASAMASFASALTSFASAMAPFAHALNFSRPGKSFAPEENSCAFPLHDCEEVFYVCDGVFYACAGIPAIRIKSLVASEKGSHLCETDERRKEEFPCYPIEVIFAKWRWEFPGILVQTVTTCLRIKSPRSKG